MKKTVLFLIIFFLYINMANAKDFNKIPISWKWINNNEISFYYEDPGTDDFSIDICSRKKKLFSFDENKKNATVYFSDNEINSTFSPDSSMVAFTKGNDLYLRNLKTKEEKRLTIDGNDVILNGYASWLYYEEIFGRKTKYKAFWWSPDSKYIAFYRFDNSDVPVFPIYSPFGASGKLDMTRYPIVGASNPKVKIGIANVDTGNIVWSDFNYDEDVYFGTPFWGMDSRFLFVSKEPRTQNKLELYRVGIDDGSVEKIYSETYPTWLDWIEGVLFTSKGLYMVRNFETGWQQIYFLSYDGKEFRRITSGDNWRMSLVAVNESKSEVFFTAERGGQHVRQGLYKVDKRGNITALTPTDMDVSGVVASPDGRHFALSASNYTTPSQLWIIDASALKKSFKIADMAKESYKSENYRLPELVYIKTKDGFVLPGAITFPKDFNPAKKYPVHVDIYGGPDTPLVRDRWKTPDENSSWWSDNEIIELVADCRAAGHNGRLGMDMIYRQLDVLEVEDFVQWAAYLKGLPYVDSDKIGVEGFSFGGTMTALLVIKHNDLFHYGIAGGGVYDWALYDTHYTERFMDTPQNNPYGYEITKVISAVKNYPVEFNSICNKKTEPVMLKLTHGTADDNVHFQSTLQLVDALHREGKKFELMIYPDAKHGYRGYQGDYSKKSNRAFWLKYLKNQ